MDVEGARGAAADFFGEGRESMTAASGKSGDIAARITERIAGLEGWRAETLARVRELIHEADPEIVEEIKWEKPSKPGIPVWCHDGIVCTGEAYKAGVKLTFARGASLKDPKKLFTSSLEGNVRRAVDIGEGEKINEAALKALIRAAVEANEAVAAGKKKKKADSGNSRGRR
jgi:hypothetical protein